MNAVDAMQPSEGAAGEAALLRATAAQQGRRMPVHELIAQTRHATLAVKPCFLTVPAEASRLLPADLHFDVVIVDEASRMPVPDAVTCAYRGAALVVVGDDRQITAAGLPGGDGQSILDLAVGCGAFRVIDLGTHYRSRHESLIAFANHSFYQGRLNTFPAAGPPGPDAGVQLFPATGETPLAGMVASRVAHHLVTRPDLTLGVVACSPEQAHEIETAVHDMVEAADDDRLRGFFVKDLDTVQGDERDVVILAISEELGGLAGTDGWRRLNVATTRAARRLEVVSAVRGRDLPETGELRHLAAYLDYAVRGDAALNLDDTLPDEQTPFEDSVRDVIRSWGYQVRARVGTGSFRIDLAVSRNARRNAPFALGIECDGTTYDSAHAARDRDRLREQELQRLGWRLHRIWGTAWYLDRPNEEERLRAAIDAAFAEFPEEQTPELTVTVTDVPVEAPVSPAPTAEARTEFTEGEFAGAEFAATTAGFAEPETTFEDEFPPAAEAAGFEEVAVEDADQYATAAGLAEEEPAYHEVVAEQAGAYLAGVDDTDRQAAGTPLAEALPEPGVAEPEPAVAQPHTVWPAATGMEFDDDLEPTYDEQPDVVAAVEDYQGVFPATFEHVARIDEDVHPYQATPPAPEPVAAELPPEPVTAQRRTGQPAPGDWAHPYRKARLDPLPPGAGLTDPGTHDHLVAAVRRIAEAEGPVHVSVALQRMREEWALVRISKPARLAVEAVLPEAGIAWDGTFLSDPDQPVPAVRYRADGVARKPDQVADAEVRVALEHLVHDGGVLTEDELLAATARLYGWAARRPAELDDRLTGLIGELVEEGRLLQQADGLTIGHGLPDPTSLPRHEAAPKRRASRPRRTAVRK
jgi:hypothetical protein